MMEIFDLSSGLLIWSLLSFVFLALIVAGVVLIASSYG
jgi:hypothetical protein